MCCGKQDKFKTCLHLVIGMLENYLVFTGRPNAGKSSIIREITGLDVRIGKRPGTTRWISEYPLSKGLLLVDMPGYGKTVRTTKRLQDERNSRAFSFLESNAQRIALAVHVLDISTFSEVTWRLGNKNLASVDVDMIQHLRRLLGEFPLVAANKIDKANKEEIDANLREFSQHFGSNFHSAIGRSVFPVSARTGEGLSPLKSAIHERLVVKGFRTPFRQD
jgi:GTP-binding protein EngB required for normal cell division